MSKKRLLLPLGSIITGVILLTLGVQSKNSVGRVKSVKATAQSVSPVPEYVHYMFLFHHIAVLREKAEAQPQGRYESLLSSRFKDELLLDDDKFKALTEIAVNYEREVRVLDQRAKVIIDKFREQFPDGKVPEGKVVPPPPTNLIALQEERNQASLRARDDLRKAFGEEEFAQFDNYVKLSLASNVKAYGPAR